VPAALAVLLAFATLGGSVSVTRPATADTPREHTIQWRACGREFQCGAISVPVDYADPGGAHTRIAVSRTRALDRQRRIGSLVVNFGGPGDPGTVTLRGFVAELPDEIRDRYDIVSFDPRGTGKSRPIDCVSDAASDALAAVDPTPDSAAQLRSFYDGKFGSIDVVQSCIDRHGTWLARVGTRNVARDLDRLRAALSERTLTYLGYSYGTVIGSVYAQQFPDRVRRMVLDAPVDLSVTAEGEVDESPRSFENALDAFLRHCEERERCAFHSSGRPRTALRRLQHRFEHGLTLPTFDEDGSRNRRRAGVAAFYTALVAGLYDEDFGWSDLAYALSQAVRGDGSVLLSISDAYNGRRGNGTYDTLAESSSVIVCADRPDPIESFDDWVAEYRDAAAKYPFLGGFVTDTPTGCDPRLPRATDAELLGDVRVANVAPVLVIGTTGDPATPFAGARDLVQRIAASRLLTFVSSEHTAYPKTACMEHAVDRYLLDGKLPRTGTRCRRS
jgi:pimeloyl-ACP methyl ester carboxylesterase